MEMEKTMLNDDQKPEPVVVALEPIRMGLVIKEEE